MTYLRQIMLEELQRRNYSNPPATVTPEHEPTGDGPANSVISCLADQPKELE